MLPKLYSWGCPWCGKDVEGPFYTISSSPSGDLERRAHNDCYKRALDDKGLKMSDFKQVNQSTRTETFVHPKTDTLKIVRKYENDKIKSQYVQLGRYENSAQFIHEGEALDNVIQTLLKAKEMFGDGK